MDVAPVTLESLHPTAPADPPRLPDAELPLRRIEILQAVEAATRAAPTPARWRPLKGSRSLRQLRGDAAELLVSLQAQFPDNELVATRVVERGVEGTLHLSPIFGDARSTFLLRRDEHGRPIDVVSARGVLTGTQPELLRLAAAVVKEGNDPESPVLLAADDAEVFLCHRLKIPFTCGPSSVDGELLRALFAARPAHRRARQYTFVLAGWQMGQLINSTTSAALKTIQHLVRATELYRYDTDILFRVWLPTHAAVADVRHAIRLSDRDLLRGILQRSLSASTFTPADAVTLIEDRTPVDFATARTALARTIADSREFPLVADADAALTKLTQTFEREITTRLARSGGDAWQQLLGMMAADCADAWFNNLDAVAAAHKVRTGQHPGGLMDQQRLKDRLATVNAYAKLYRLHMPRH